VTDVDNIAIEVKEGFAKDVASGWEALVRYFADPVEIAHVPPDPTDGPVPVDAASAYTRGVAVTLTKINDFAYSADVRSDGERITIDLTVSGQSVDGEAFTTPLSFECYIDEGKLVRQVASVDPVAMAPLAQALAATGAFPTASH
jgi:hypothetical protein